MAILNGKSYTRAELLQRVGDISQVARVKPYRLIEGFEDGVFGIDVTTGSGLDFSILPSRGLDISSASYNGRSMAWRSATTDTHPSYFDHEGENGRGWLRGFYGGLVVSCGMAYAGANGTDNGQNYGLHGRVSNLPATNVSWDGEWVGDDYVLTVKGKLREATVFGENIQLTRTIQAKLGERKFTILDEVENMGFKVTEHMMLYHINIGFPAVNDDARIVSPTISAEPRDEEAVSGYDRYTKLQPPQAGFNEQVYFHTLAKSPDGKVTTAIVSEGTETAPGAEKGFGVYCKYNPDQLPRFIEWKMMDAGTYVVGMEPANCLVMGRAAERSRGTLLTLQPGEIRKYELEIGVLNSASEIAELETACQAAIGNIS